MIESSLYYLSAGFTSYSLLNQRS